jgi:hypothetical protein
LDYFKDMKSLDEVLHSPIEIKDEIPEAMPKYAKSFEERFAERMANAKTPQDFLAQLGSEYDPSDSMKEFRLKEAFNAVGMYGFVSWKWVNPFVEWIAGRKCLEVMAGRGWLSHALRIKGVDVIATDDFSWSDQRAWKQPMTAIEKLDAIESVEKYGKDIDILIMSWPYMDDTAYRVIKKLYEVNPGVLVVYIGEWGGCTANEDFFDHFCKVITATDQSKWEQVIHNFQSWEHLHDRIYLGRYCEEDNDV